MCRKLTGVVKFCYRNWHLLGCQAQPVADVHVNTAASHHWSRAASALGRLSQYLVPATAHTWHMLVADDYHLEAGGTGYQRALVVFLVVCAACGVPLSWNKTAAGDSVVDRLRTASTKLQVGNVPKTGRLVHTFDREVASADMLQRSNFKD